MKRFAFNVVLLIIAILIIPGCSENESDFYDKWENENRAKWEQEAENLGYEKGYEEGFKDGETETQSKIEEEKEIEEKDWDAILEQEREASRESLRKYAEEFGCLVWDELEKFDFTIDLQRNAVGKRYAVMAYPTDLFLSSDSIVMKANGRELPDLFYLEISDALEKTAREVNYEDCALIITVESVAPLDMMNNYIEYGDSMGEEAVLVGDATIEYELWTGYRLINGTCEKIIPLDK